jgi:hypothetical protein
MKHGSKFIRNTRIIFRKEENGAYLYDPDSGNLKYINRIGTSLFELCDGLHLVEGMTSLIAREYQDISVDEIGKDVERFLTDLLQMGFLKRIP